ncbi:TPA_asm: RNA-directed RNA polymerase [ssRNA phage Esthiorhiza.2_29]|uniref:RNA-directed RNA polymerase n=2 Tax=Leviviricetes TaxID=2842243 RepID=A0A8S5L301_9VIRU|nr:RNA-directed RNA polymerase [ssRNA phage Esthiorhiza.2_29]QDH87106.1 MAG: RNA-dependent RNA polymerase [Leviviridae sp.]DAD51875.1 TPA_asm: RNA-directed RNA polymerase [ssRNA phage Esthiorhiza.2_29]
MKSLIEFQTMILADAGVRCGVSTLRDSKTISDRIKGEGLSFLTITLTDFGKSFEQCLDRGSADLSDFPGFRKRGKLPILFGGFLDLIFDRRTGLLLDEVSPIVIQTIRQLTLMFGKIELECTNKRTLKAIDGYVKCELEVKSWSESFMGSLDLRERFTHVATFLFRDVFASVENAIYYGELLPKHGPGSTAEKGLLGNKKYYARTWTDRLEAVFPYGEYGQPNWSEVSPDVHFYEPGSEPPVEVITVPKTLKTPRIIAKEPVHMQFLQQGLLELFSKEIGMGKISSFLIDYSSQEPNQRLARLGSLDGNLATLDLSEASDRVSNELVKALLAGFPLLSEAVQATRSTRALVPGHGIIPLSKFASMGSALCFPIESMVFATIVIMGIQDALNASTNVGDIHARLKNASRQFTLAEVLNRVRDGVRVYGDDIVVPSISAQSVIRSLESFGLKVNGSKSFWTGMFRESCGKEYYRGSEVTLTRLRKLLPPSRRSAPEVISMVAMRNLFFDRGGYDITVAWLDRKLERLLRFYPFVHPSSPVLGRHAYNVLTERMHPDLQIPLVKGYVVKATLPTNPLEGYGALFKFFLKRGFDPIADAKHLERSGRPQNVYIKLKWASSY